MKKIAIIAWHIRLFGQKNDLPSAQFRSLLLRLISDKDHEKVFDIVSKVDKSFKRDHSYRGRSASQVP